MTKRAKQTEQVINILKSVELKSEVEMNMVNTAIGKITRGDNQERVIRELKGDFSLLALRHQLSSEGIKLLENMMKPNVNNIINGSVASLPAWFP